MASTVSRQRTGRVKTLVSSARTSSNGFVVSDEKTVKAGSCNSVSSSAARNGSTPTPCSASGRRRRRRPRWCGGRIAGGLLGRLEPVARAGEDDLAGRVVVGDGHAGRFGDRRGLLFARADQREHRADVVGLGHQLAAQHDELQRVVALEHAGGGERGQLAERVAAPAAASRPSASQPARLAQKMAGCAKRVDSPARGNGSSPTSAMQRSSRSGHGPRRGRACRVSGCPGRETARPGRRGR